MIPAAAPPSILLDTRAWSGTSYAYAYDPDGNRTSVTQNSGTPTVSSYDVSDQLLTEGPQGGTATSFNYDPCGNMTTSAETFNSGTTVYTYDLGDRLTKVTPPAGLSGANTYTLDALGRIASRSARTGQYASTIQYRTRLGAFNADGTTKTFFKPQPGVLGGGHPFPTNIEYDVATIIQATRDVLNEMDDRTGMPVGA